MQEADAGAAAAMRRTEAIVTDELEAKAVYSRVKEAVEAAERSLAAIHAGEEDVAEADAKAKDSGSEEEGEVVRPARGCKWFFGAYCG